MSRDLSMEMDSWRVALEEAIRVGATVPPLPAGVHLSVTGDWSLSTLQGEGTIKLSLSYRPLTPGEQLERWQRELKEAAFRGDPPPQLPPGFRIEMDSVAMNRSTLPGGPTQVAFNVRYDGK